MMKNLMKWTSLILASAMVMTAISCRKTGSVTYNEITPGTVEVKITSNIGDNGAVRAVPAAVGGTWSDNDAIGVFMVDHSTRGVLLNANNKRYETSAGGTTGSFVAASAGEKIYYPANSDADVDFIAYYPYNAYGSNITALTDAVSVDVSDQSDSEDIDLLYATTTAGYNRTTYNTPVPLTFKHQLSNLVINVTSEDITDLSASLASVEIQGLNTKASFNLSSGALTGQGTPDNIEARKVTPGVKYDAIVLPESYTELKVKFTISDATISDQDGDYIWTAAAGSFEPYKRYTCNIRLVEDRAVLISATIEDWDDVSLTGGDATEP
jgi:hypothetical protein